MLSKLSALFRRPALAGFSSDTEACPWPLPPRGIDFPLLFAVLAMLIFGLLMVYSSSYILAQEKMGDGFAFIKKQALFGLAGLAGMAVTTRIDYRRWNRWAVPGLILAFVLLALVLVPGIGAKVGGARRWIRLGPINLQPGEFVKFAVIFFVARQLDRKQDRIHTFTAGILSNFLVPLPALVLLMLQPDFGTTAMICVVVFTLIFLAGAPKRYFAGALALAGVVGAWLVMGSSYRHARIMTYLDPWRDPGGKGFQIIQSMVGFHNGSFWGAGLGNGREKLFFLPEAHNDFIFSVIGEELGFVGVVAMILVYLFVLNRGLKIAQDCHRKYQDRFGMLLASGITLALGLQGFVNMSVVLGLLPTKGLTLPFISYGGSALLADLMAAGILLSIARGPQRGSEI